MNLASDKTKEYGIIALKVLILSFCFIFIYNRLSSTESKILSSAIDKFSSGSAALMIGIPMLAFLNWALEIRKWQLLASTVERISYRTAVVQSLSALSAALWTPNRIGEYGAKAMYFASDKRKKIMLMKLFGNSSQLLCTLVFGIPGLIFLTANYQVELSALRMSLLLAVVLFLLILGYRYRRRTLLIKGLSISNIIKHLKGLSGTVKYSVIGLSAFRYLVFGGMFLLLLLHFEASRDLMILIAFISSVYIISSVIPSFVLFDVAVKGGVAVWLASIMGLESTAVLSAILLMWIMNFVLPAIFGSYFVIRYKPQPH